MSADSTTNRLRSRHWYRSPALPADAFYEEFWDIVHDPTASTTEQSLGTENVRARRRTEGVLGFSSQLRVGMFVTRAPFKGGAVSETDNLSDRPGPLDRMLIGLMPLFTRMHVWIFRNLEGRFAGKTSAGGPILMLTTTGRRTGEKRSVALGYLDEDDSFYVVASNGGKHNEPGWSYNLKADPNAEIKYRGGKVQAEVELLEGKDREEAWKRYIAAYPDYAQAQHWAGREFPLYRIPMARTN